jgi:hypothetical protein
MCICDSYVFQKVFFVFLLLNVISGQLKGYCFVRQYAAVPAQLEIVIRQYIGWYGIFSSINLAASASF